MLCLVRGKWRHASMSRTHSTNRPLGQDGPGAVGTNWGYKGTVTEQIS